MSSFLIQVSERKIMSYCEIYERKFRSVIVFFSPCIFQVRTDRWFSWLSYCVGLYSLPFMYSLSLVSLTLCPFAFSCCMIGYSICLLFSTDRGHCSLTLILLAFNASLLIYDASLTFSLSPYLWNFTTIGRIRESCGLCLLIGFRFDLHKYVAFKGTQKQKRHWHTTHTTIINTYS